MNTIRINIELPENIYKALFLFRSVNQSNQFFANTIKQQLKIEKQKQISLLADGYKNSKIEDKRLINDFEIADFENID